MESAAGRAAGAAGLRQLWRPLSKKKKKLKSWPVRVRGEGGGSIAVLFSSRVSRNTAATVKHVDGARMENKYESQLHDE